MRLIHFSDTHLGFAESSKVDPSTGVNTREQDVYRSFNAVVDAAIKIKPDIVIHAGDLFHSARPSNRAIVTALVGFQRLTVAGIPLILVAGNHSMPRLAASGPIFDAFRVLSGVYSAHGCKYEVFLIGDAAIHCLPHMPTDQGLQTAIESVRPRKDKKFNILVMHAAVRGTDDSSPATLAGLGEFDYVALGHYHRHIQVNSRAWYSGSTERLHVNEAGYPKGFLEVDLARGKQKFHPLAPRDIAVLPVLKCHNKAATDIISHLRKMLSGQELPSESIVVVRLEGIDPVTWIELQQERRSLECELLSTAFEVRWEKSFSERKLGRGIDQAIGSLAAEFAAFMRNTKVEGLNRKRLENLGERLITQAQEAEVLS